MTDYRQTTEENELRDKRRTVTLHFADPQGNPVAGCEAILSFHISRMAEGIDDAGNIYLDPADIIYSRQARITIPALNFEIYPFSFSPDQKTYTIVVG